MADKKISWCNWSLCDKNETSAAALIRGQMLEWLEQFRLSDSGKIVFNSFKIGIGESISVFSITSIISYDYTNSC